MSWIRLNTTNKKKKKRKKKKADRKVGTAA